MFVVGTSLVVEPVNSLPGVALSGGAGLVVVNKGCGTQYDEYAVGVVDEAAGEFFGAVGGMLGE